MKTKLDDSIKLVFKPPNTKLVMQLDFQQFPEVSLGPSYLSGESENLVTQKLLEICKNLGVPERIFKGEPDTTLFSVNYAQWEKQEWGKRHDYLLNSVWPAILNKLTQTLRTIMPKKWRKTLPRALGNAVYRHMVKQGRWK